ncbi:MAG: MAPEG family protein [Congregibacter sp.]
MPEITVLYAGLLGIVSMVLSGLCGAQRGKTGVSIGDGGNEQMMLAMRRHGNFVEHVPIVLIIIALLEMNAVSNTAIHILGGGLVFCRVAHASGLQAGKGATPGRIIGAAGTLLITAVSSVWAVVVFF